MTIYQSIYLSIYLLITTIKRTDEYDDIYRALHITRSIPSIPKNQSYITLRNNVPMPTIGLGTGGLVPGEETYTTMETANKYYNQLLSSMIRLFSLKFTLIVI